jgi:nitroreductase
MVNALWQMPPVAIARNSSQIRTMQFNDTSSLLSFLKTRKSASAKAMGAPGPDGARLEQMLALATRVPDHGKLTPWRFVVFQGEARSLVGAKYAARWKELNPGHGDEILAFQAGLFMRAPVVVAVISTAQQHAKIPVWEQQMSAAAVCFNMELAAQALGFDVQWQTDWVAYDATAKAAMGVSATENVAGLIYIGTSTAPLEDRPRPDAKSLTKNWHA